MTVSSSGVVDRATTVAAGQVAQREPAGSLPSRPAVVGPSAARHLSRGALIAVVLTCVVAVVDFAGAVTNGALFGFVLPATLIGAGIAAWQAQHGAWRLAVGLGLPVVLAWSEFVNITAGQGNGPAARSSAVAGGCAVLAVVFAASPAPALFLVPAAGIVLGAMLLGAGGEVRVVALATVVVAVVALAVVDSSRRHWVPRSASHHRPREISVVVLSVLVAGAVVAVVLLQGRADHRAPHAAVRGSSNAMVKPSFGDPLPAQAATSAARPPPARPPAGQPPPPRRRHTRHHGGAQKPVKPPHRSLIPLIVAAVVLLLQLALFTRRIVVLRAWRATRRRLSGGTPRAAVTGAWIWVGILLDACRTPLPASTSPDVAARDPSGVPDRSDPAEPLRQLGRLVSPAAFSVVDEIPGGSAVTAWRLADEVKARLEAGLPFHRRIRIGFSTPPRRSAGASR